MINTIKFLLSTCCILMIPSCVPAVVAGGVIVGTSIAEERSAGDRIDDNIIKLKIQDRLGQEDFSEMFARVSVTVHEGRVLLTGSIKDQSYSNQTANIVWAVAGVKEVINELEISSRTIGSVTNDTIAANAIRSKILFDREVKSVNYKIDVNNGVAYILGVAKNSNELNKVVEIVRKVKGIKKVINHAILIGDNRRKKEI